MVIFSRWFKGRKQDLQLPKEEEVDEVDLLEQEEANLLYGLPPVDEGQVTITNSGVSPAEGGLLASFFICNGLSDNVKFDNLPLVLIDSEKQVLARQLFDGETIGEIASGTAKACVVRFDESNVFELDLEECQVCFDVPLKAFDNSQMRFQTLPKNLTEREQQKLESILAELTPMRPGEMNISPLQAQITSDRDLVTTVIIRNSSVKQLHLEKIALVVFDAHRQEIARTIFYISNLIIEPYKAILWTFNFGQVEQDKDVDLTKWHISLANKDAPLHESTIV